jgi:branched-chain amino acid transport system permease protein
MSELPSPSSAPGPGAATATSPTEATAAADAPSAQAGRRSLLPRSTLLRHLLLTLVCAAGAVLLLEVTDQFTNSQLSQVAYLGIAAGGLTVLTGLNGQISLGHGALMAVGAYATALLLDVDGEPLPLALIWLIAVAVTTVVGAIVGVAAARLHGPYLAGATLALAVGVPGLALYFRDTFGGAQGLQFRGPRAPQGFKDFIGWLSGNPASNTKWEAYLATLALLITFLLLANLARSRIGRTWRAVRDQEVAAELAGIALAPWRVLAFVVSSACAGLGGAVLGTVVASVSPTSFTLVLSLSLLTAIVIGGLGSLIGALAGSVLLVFLPGIATDLGEGWGLGSTEAAQFAPLVYGVVLVLVMLFAPAGLVGTVRLRWLSARARRAARGRG